jgi:hypothetical protein
VADARLGKRTSGASQMRTNGSIVLLLAFALCGCGLVMSREFDKATLLTQFSIQGAGHAAQNVIDLPSGTAEIILAVPNHHCSPVDLRTTVRVRLEGDGFQSIDLAMRLGDLTWSHGMNSCHAYGYLYDSTTGLGRKLAIPDRAKGVRVSVTTSGSDANQTRTGSVWMVYGGRVPTARLFKD